MAERPNDSPTNPPLIRPSGGAPSAPAPGRKPPGREFTEAEDTAVLAPSLAAAFLNCGVDRLHRGETDAAVSDFAEAIKIDPNLARAWCLRGYARLIQRNYENACSDLSRAISVGLSDTHEDNAWLRLWVALARTNQLARATGDLNAHFARRIDPPPAPWSLRIASFLGDSVPEGEFLAEVDGPAPHASPEKACEAWYFAGQKRLANGDRAGARAAFEKAVGSGAKGISAWSASRSELLGMIGARS